MSKHLHERGSSFQYRRVFPQDVRTTAGRRELTRSLKVKTKKEAELEAALWDVEFENWTCFAKIPANCLLSGLSFKGLRGLPA